MNKEEIIQTFGFHKAHPLFQKTDEFNEQLNILRENLSDFTPITVTAYPMLGGFIFKPHQSLQILDIDMKLGYFDQVDRTYRNRPQLLGSFLSYDYFYYVDNLKSDTLIYLDKAFTDNVDFIVNGETKKIKNKTAFNKLVSSLYK